MNGDRVADDDGVVGHQNFLDQQANDALALMDVERLGPRAQAVEEGGQTLGQAQGGRALGGLIGDGAQLRGRPLLAAAQVRQTAAQFLQREQVFLIGGHQPLHGLARLHTLALQRLLAPPGWLRGVGGGQASIQLGGDQGRVLQEPDDLGPHDLIEQVLPDGAAVADRPAQASPGVGANAAIVVDLAGRTARRCPGQGIATFLADNHPLDQAGFDGTPRRKAFVVREPLRRQREGVLGHQWRDGDLDPLGTGPGGRGRLATA